MLFETIEKPGFIGLMLRFDGECYEKRRIVEVVARRNDRDLAVFSCLPETLGRTAAMFEISGSRAVVSGNGMEVPR
jgi:hypothetical protein